MAAIRNYDEFFLTSTSKNVMPIRQIDEVIVGEQFPKTRVIQKLFQSYYREKVLDVD